jgi:RNA polymerase sigma-70 factor (ECF subfamily)
VTRLDTAFARDYIVTVAPHFSSKETTAGRIPLADREKSLVLAGRRGDEEALREIYRTYRDPVWTLVVSLVGDPLQAQDIVQNVFFKVFRGLAGFRFRSSLFTWIYRIACNESRNHLRKRDVPAVPLEDIVGSRYETAVARVPDRAGTSADLVKSAVMKLPFKMREVVILKYREDLSYSEMSRILGCPPGTVASRLNRALAELEARLRAPAGPAAKGAGDRT